jgi:hypothetical protein
VLFLISGFGGVASNEVVVCDGELEGFRACGDDEGLGEGVAGSGYDFPVGVPRLVVFFIRGFPPNKNAACGYP